MLVLTEAAAEAVKALTATKQAGAAAGLRIASSAAQPSEPSALQVTRAPGPDQGDQVIETAGAHVFVEPRASAYLADKVLDAQVDARGEVHFSVGTQPAD